MKDETQDGISSDQIREQIREHLEALPLAWATARNLAERIDVDVAHVNLVLEGMRADGVVRMGMQQFGRDVWELRETQADPKPDESADEHAGYSRFADEEGNDLDNTSMEVFWNDADGPFSLRGEECDECEGTGKGELPAGSCEACEGHGSPALESGWYWWACYPGCIADGEPCGPFATSTEAYEDGRS